MAQKKYEQAAQCLEEILASVEDTEQDEEELSSANAHLAISYKKLGLLDKAKQVITKVSLDPLTLSNPIAQPLALRLLAGDLSTRHGGDLRAEGGEAQRRM